MFSLLRVFSVCIFVESIGGVLSYENDTSPGIAAEEGRIIGGVASREGAWPFMASLGRPSRSKPGTQVHFCGGVIWDDETIITAAHCLFKEDEATKETVPRPVKEITVYLGHINVKSDIDQSYLFKVLWTRPHPKYNAVKGSIRDIGIVKLERKIELKGKHSKADCICEREATLARMDTDRCFIIGWGRIQPGEHGPRPRSLQQLEVVIQPRSPSDSEERRLRVGNFREGACHGDSGGPLLCRLKYQEPTVYSLAGISSAGDPYCIGRSYYTPVHPYLYWLRAETDSEQVSGLLDGPRFYLFIFGLAVGVVVLIGAILLHLLACAAALAAILAIALVMAKVMTSG